MNVIDYANKRLESMYAINTYLKDTNLWDDTVKQIRALKAQDKHMMQVAGRLDIASLAIYGDAMLDWILMVYNNYQNVGDFGSIQIKKTIHLTLTAGEEYITGIPLNSATVSVQDSAGADVTVYYDSVGNYSYADVNGDLSPDLRIYYNSTGARIINVDPALTITFVIVYEEASEDNDLDVGTQVNYPALADVQKVLRQAKETDHKKYEGFASL
jgi:hypothetical protein